jgi:membrane-bound serine protease (ClpP class)
MIIFYFLLLALLFLVAIIGLAISAHKKKVTTGREGLLLEIGTAVTDLDIKGTIMIHGELWSAESVHGKINKDEKVEVVKVKGMTLSVKRSGQC